MKKLIPALCMLLVAACLMGTSTYAWFAANTFVTASGMSVKAAADGGLGIAVWTNNSGNPEEPGETAYAASVDLATITNEWTNQLDIANPTIKPASLNTSTGDWYTATAKANNSYAVDDTVANPYSLIASGANHYQATKWSIRSLDQSGTVYDLAVTNINVSADTNTVNLNKALRVAIKVTNDAGVASWYLFAPKYAAGDAVTFKNVTGIAKDALADATVAKTTTPNTVICTTLDSDPITLDVFVYYDGMDSNCKSDNLGMNVDELSVEIVYTASEHVDP